MLTKIPCELSCNSLFIVRNKSFSINKYRPTISFYCIYFFWILFIYFREIKRERERASGEREKDEQNLSTEQGGWAGSQDPRSPPEPKSKVRHNLATPYSFILRGS